MSKLNKRIFATVLMLAVIGLMLVPANLLAQEPPPEPTPAYPAQWEKEYVKYITWQQDSQQQYTNETGYGLGALIEFTDWAEMRVIYGPNWWKPNHNK